MSRAGWRNAASLQVVAVPGRQRHQRIPGSGPGHPSKAMCFPESRAAEWDCSSGNCLIWVWLFICLSDWWNTRPRRELITQTETECDLCSWQARLAYRERRLWRVSVCSVTFWNGEWQINGKEEWESMETSLTLWFNSMAPFPSRLGMRLCPCVKS